MTTVGITTYNYAPEDILNLAKHADRLGFDCLWFGEHYVIPQQFEGHHPSRKDTPAGQKDARDKAIISPDIRIYDPWFLLGAIAGATRSIRIGTAICIVPMLHPLLLARATATAHDISAGRFRFGTGAGWLREEFDALGVPFAERGTRLDEAIEILRKAWAGGFFEHHGRHFEFGPLQITPHPVQVPLVCGGNSGPALRRVAEVADAWINSAMVTLDEAQELREVVERERRVRGTDRRAFEYFVRPHSVDPDEVQRFARAGFDNIVLWGPNCWPNDPALPLQRKVECLEEIARNLGLHPAKAPA